MQLDLEKVQEKLAPIAGKISQNIYLQAIMKGMVMVLPITIMAAFVTLLKIFPLPAYQEFLVSHHLLTFFDIPLNFTNNFMAVIVSFAIAYALANILAVDAFPAGLLSMIGFFIMTPFNVGGMTPMGLSFSIPSEWLGAQGLFTGILVAFVTARIYAAITRKGIIIKVPDSVPEFIAKSFSSLIPGLLILSMYTVISACFSVSEYKSIHQLIYSILQAPLTALGSGIWSVIILSVICQFLWFMGLHGHAITLGVISPVWMAMDIQQLAAFSTGQELPYITGLGFFWTYTAGDLLPLAFMLAFMAKSERYKTLGKMAFVPAIFTIGEPLAYGVPLVMNVVFLIPYVVMNAVSLGLAYALTDFGILPQVAGINVPSGTPVILSGLMQGSWKIAAFQGVLFFLRFAAWYVFFKIADNMAVRDEQTEGETVG